MSVIASIIRGISTTAAGTLTSAELSFQQAIRSPTATANGNDRQTLLWHRRRRPVSFHTEYSPNRPNPEEQVPTNTLISTKIPKMKGQVTVSELVPQKPGDLRMP
jgi:hypothetical protein